MSKKRLRVALITPQIAGHKYRGTGTYTDKLYQALQKIREIEVKHINIKDNFNDFDLIHFPYFDPFFLTLPLIKKKPTVITIHDLIPLKFPEYFPRGIRGEIKWQIQKFSLLQSATLITDSFASKEDILSFIEIDKNKVQVVYLGVDNEFIVINEKEKLRKLEKKLNLPSEFILHVGDVNYNKNIVGLIRAFDLVSKSYPRSELVFVGNGFIDSSPQLLEILDLLKKLKIEGRVHRLGFIDKEDLVCVYNLAKIYLQPSFAEGFGLPVLEAMACGLPIIASNLSSLPEIVGNAGLLVDPNNVEQIASGILAVYTDQKKRGELIEKGLTRAKLFTWGKCARETIKIYQKVSGKGLTGKDAN